MRLDEIAKNDKELDEVLPAIAAAARGVGAVAGAAGRGIGAGARAVGRGVKTAVTDPKAAAKATGNFAGQALGHAMRATDAVANLTPGGVAAAGRKMGADAKYGDPDFGNDENMAAAMADPAKKAQMKRDMQQALRDKEEQLRTIRDKMRELN